jgi:hypothetical protein
MWSAGSAKSSASRPKPGMLAVQPKPDGLNVLDRHLERIARLGALDEDRPGHRVDPVEVEARDVGDGAVGRKLAAGGVKAFELDRRAGRHPLGRGNRELSQPK